MALFLIALALAAVLLFLLSPKRIRFALLLAGSGLHLRAQFMRIPFARRFAWDRILISMLERKKRRRKRKRGIRLRELRAGIDFPRLCARGRLGTGDAAQTAVLCGALGGFFQALLTLLPGDERPGVFLTPDFKKSVFWINLGGILIIYPGKIIAAFVVTQVKEGFETWRIRLKTSWKPQWISSRKQSM